MTLPDTISRRSLRDEVFDAIHNRVIARAYKPGEWLRQEDIASQLGVSMTPVREALDMLVAAGLAERETYRGVRVVALSPEEILDAYGLRLLLEPAAARLAAGRADPAQVRDLRRILGEAADLVRTASPRGEAERGNELSLLRRSSREFHSLLVEMSGDPLLAKLCEVVANKFPDWMLYEAVSHRPDDLPASLQGEQDQHRAIVDAIAAQDAPSAARVARAHLLSLGRDLQNYLGLSPELVAEREALFAPDP